MVPRPRQTALRIRTHQGAYSTGAPSFLASALARCLSSRLIPLASSPRTQHPKDAVENTPIVHPGDAARLVRQRRLDGGPFKVGKFIARDSKLPSLRA